jgi:hypothetical protein
LIAPGIGTEIVHGSLALAHEGVCFGSFATAVTQRPVMSAMPPKAEVNSEHYPQLTKEFNEPAPKFARANLMSEARILQNPRDAAISANFIARTGEICMTIVYSQTVPSRSMLMPDACLAL